jgi:ABC-2 type transport system ATP-binding protein
MESVEELCDDIALIHKSNKLLEGPLQDIKRQFRTNSYEVGILTDNAAGLQAELSQTFTIQPTEFKSLNNELQLQIQLNNSSPNELLHALTQRGQVTHFMEKIPSVNDIFIQTVQNN